MDLIADTTVLIDVWRYKNKRERIHDLVDKAGSNSLVVPWIVQAEFKRGALHRSISKDEISVFLCGFLLTAIDQVVIDTYWETCVEMAKKGKPIDYPDLWIAATAVKRPAPLLTRHPKHFQGISGLEIGTYSISQK